MSAMRTSPRVRQVAWPWAAGALALLVGYVDLARGGTDVASFALVLGYCVFLPIAILKR